MDTSEQRPTPAASRCVGCGAPLAHDQRYCTACGIRRGPLPDGVWAALRRLAAHGRPDAEPEAEPIAPDGENAESGSEPTAPDEEDATAQLPRREAVGFACAAAASVLLMVGAGSVMGAATSPGGVETLADTVVVALSPSHHAAPQTLASAAPSTPAGAGAGAGGAGGGGGRRATTQAQRTVTVSESGSSPGSTSSTSTTSSTPAGGTTMPPIRHVWEIVLSGQAEQQAFAATSGNRYLARTLAGEGTLLADFDAVAASPLADEIALVSGQGPTEQTLGDCAQYSDIVPGRIGRDDQALGSGCLYPSTVQTLGSELAIQGDSWRAFIQGLDTRGQRTATTTTAAPTTAAPAPTTTAPAPTTTTDTDTTPPTTPGTTTTDTTSSAASGTPTTPITDTATAAGCAHPALGAADPGQVGADDDYVTWKNPWVYFRSVLTAGSCAQDDVGLGRLRASLAHERTTPSLSYITPDPCDDGSDTPCRPGARAGLAGADAFLERVVPAIERSPAYRAGGLILITFDEAPQSGPNWSTASCCGQPTYPNLPTSAATATSTTATGTTTTGGTATTTTATAPSITGTPPGGGQVGLLMISPYVTPGTIDELHEYNDFSLLKTLTQLFGVPALGYAAEGTVASISPSLFLRVKR